MNSPEQGAQNRMKLHGYIEAIEDKFLKTFSLPEKEKAAAYRTLESEIKKMLDILSGSEIGQDIQMGINNSLECICSVTNMDEFRKIENKEKPSSPIPGNS